MDRVSSRGHIIVHGKRRFSDGDPHAEPAIEATELTADFMNALQEELCTVIEGQDLTLESTDNGQLSEAIHKIVASALSKPLERIDKLEQEVGI